MRQGRNDEDWLMNAVAGGGGGEGGWRMQLIR